LTTGASLQALSDDKVLGHDNNFVIGASVDRSKIGFQANSELGFIYPDLFVGPNAAVPGTGEIIRTAGNLGFSPVSLAAWQTYYGAYFNETFDLTNRLSLTAGGRYNLAAIDMADLFGTSPDLSASYTYARFNPVTGLTYKILPELMTFYAGYSEANRIPTPLELGCSNPQKPCLLEGFLVSDPPLQQVVAEPLRLGSVETSIWETVAATGSSGCSIPTAKTTLFKSRASSRAAACSRTFHLHAAKGWKRVPTTKRDNTSSTPIMLSSMPLISSVESWHRRTILSETRMETSSLLPASRFPAYRGTRSKVVSTIGLRRS